MLYHFQELSSQVKRLEHDFQVAKTQYECELDTRQKMQHALREARIDRAKALQESEKSRVRNPLEVQAVHLAQEAIS